jgi:hypothetical protein
MNEAEKYQKAKERVEEIKGFYIHLFVFIIINCGLLTINLVFASHHYWFYWPLLGWGIGIAAHGLSVFGLGGFLGREWEEKQIKKIMDKMD